MAEDLPPPYSEAVLPPYEPVSNQVSTVVNVETGATQTAIEVMQQIRHSEGRQNNINNCTTRFEGRDNVRLHHRITGTQNASNSFSGLLDILHEQRKLPWNSIKNRIYKLGLFIYYFVNFVYSIVALAVQKDHLAYHIVYIFICFTGFVFELIIMTVNVKKCLIQSSGMERDTMQNRSNQIGHTNQPQQAWTTNQQVQDYHRKAKSVFLDYAVSSLGELLIYPILICNLYGVINERAWHFDNGISVCNFLLFLYSVIMDALYMKFYVTWLVVIRVVCASYVKYDELKQPTQVEWKRYFTPVYLSIPLAIMTVLTHWLMTGIIGVRIYVDNSTAGDYRVAPLTGCMIACTIYLPIVSWITYIIINKVWFYEVYSAINQLGNGADCMPEQNTWDKKLFDFIHKYLSYIAAVFLLLPFILFSVGCYLPDYDSSQFEVASSARDAIQGLAPCFIILFLLSNIQAAICFIILIIAFIILSLCGLPILCGVCCYKCCNAY